MTDEMQNFVIENYVYTANSKDIHHHTYKRPKR